MNLTQNILKYNDFLKIPSVSVEKSGIQESIDFLSSTFYNLNAESVHIWDDFGGAPIIVGKFKGISSKTILIYNHYDVQPIGNLSHWHTPPFEPTIIDNCIYSRGISDCKGEIISRLLAIEELQKNNNLQYNVIYMIEGEEEIGSPNLKEYIQKYKNELAADICLWECGWKNENEELEICCGVKGILSFDLSIRTAVSPIHSSFSGIVPNPAQRLASALSTIIDTKNNILIPHFHEDILPLETMTKKAFDNLNADFSLFYSNNGIHNNCPENIIDKLYNQPTFNISQFSSGNENGKNSTPNDAIASIDCRFLPNQNPEKLLKLIRSHLDKEGFSDIKILNCHYENAYRSNLQSPTLQNAINSANKIYGKDNIKIIPNFSGGGPMHLFGNILNLPIVSLGVSYAKSNVHAPNENIRLSDLEQNKQCLIDLLSTVN